MTTPRKPLKPVKGWVVVGPSGSIYVEHIRSNASAAWISWAGDKLGSRIFYQKNGYRAVPVVVMERGKK